MKNLSEYINKKGLTLSLNPYNTFIIIKPGFINKSNEILQLFLDNGYTVSKYIARKLDYATAAKLYAVHKDEDFYENLCKYMSSGVSVGYCLNYSGSEDPIKKTSDIKDNIRKTYGKDDMKNTLHSSDSIDNVYKESKIYFK